MRAYRLNLRWAAGAALALLLAMSGPAASAERGLWMRYPAISPDGKAIAFSYKGNLWKVASTRRHRHAAHGRNLAQQRARVVARRVEARVRLGP